MAGLRRGRSGEGDDRLGVAGLAGSSEHAQASRDERVHRIERVCWSKKCLSFPVPNPGSTEACVKISLQSVPRPQHVIRLFQGTSLEKKAPGAERLGTRKESDEFSHGGLNAMGETACY